MKPIFILPLFVMLCACTVQHSQDNDIVPHHMTSDTIGLAITPDDGSEPMTAITYMSIPSDTTCTTILTIYSYRNSGDGLFCLQTFEGDNRLTFTGGKRFTLRGENDATIWQCHSNEDSAYFLISAETDTIYRISSETDMDDRYPLVPLSMAK